MYPLRFVTLLALLLLVGCGRPAPTVIPADPAHRNPLAWGEDGFFPVPSDVYRTNGRLQLDAAVWGERVLAKAPTFADTALQRLAQRDGFAPNLPILALVPARVDSASVRITDFGLSDSAVRLLREVDGAPVPITVETLPLDGGDAGTLLIVNPMMRLADGTRYLVLVRGVRNEAGAPVPPAAAVAGRFAGNDENVQAVGEAVTRLAPAADDLQLAFLFTTGSRYGEEFRALKRDVDTLARARPFTLMTAGPSKHRFPWWPAGTAWDVIGTFDGWRFVDEHGRILDRPTPYKVSVQLSLPEECPAGGCPVVIFCHGFQASKETMNQVAGPLNRVGIAVIGVDGLWHESFLRTMHVMREIRKHYDVFAGLIYQHVALQWQLRHLVTGDLADLDVLPVRTFGADGDGVPDLDVTRIGFVGQSLGGISGVTAFAYEPEFDAAIFNVAGGGFYAMFGDSMLRGALRIPMFDDIDGLSSWEGAAATAFASYAVDFVDPLLTAGVLRDDPRPRFLQVGLGDGLVPNTASDLLARSLGMTRITEAPADRAWNLPVQADAPWQNIYSYTEFGGLGYLPHLALNGEAQQAEVVRFFREHLGVSEVQSAAK